MICDKYLGFFLENHDSRHVMLQGSRRSGKTWATFSWLRATRWNKTILVACNAFDQLKNTMADFEACTGHAIRGSKKETYCADTENGVHWIFNYYDSINKVQGTMADDLFINEALNFDEATARTLYMGIRGQVFYNFNPTSSFWIEPYVNEQKSNILVTTWKDNEANLTPEQIAEFEDMKRRAEMPTASIFDKYNYKVFYLGEFSDLGGSVFGQIHTCSAEDYDAIPVREALGMDFGFAVAGDPTSLVGAKIYNGRLYLRQYIYAQGITTDDIAEMLTAIGKGDCEIAGDYGGDGRQRMDDLIDMGFEFVNAIKGSVKGGLEVMRKYCIYVTEDSFDLRREMGGLAYEAGRLKAENGDHAIDAARYATNYHRYMYDGVIE